MAENTNVQMKQLLDFAIEKGASDLHVTVGLPAAVRIDGRLYPIADAGVITPDRAKDLLKSIMTDEQMESLEQRKELDFSFGYQKMRFRTNAFYQKGQLTAALRLIPTAIRS